MRPKRSLSLNWRLLRISMPETMPILASREQSDPANEIRKSRDTKYREAFATWEAISGNKIH
jgi:hypothetical protein